MRDPGAPDEPRDIEPRTNPTTLEVVTSSTSRTTSVARSAIDTLSRIAPFVERLARGALKLAAAALMGATFVWLLVARESSDRGRALTLILWAAVLLVPPAILVVVSIALRQLASVPERLRRIPEETRERAAELRRLAGEARRVRERGRLRSMWSVVRLGRRAAEARELLELAAPVAFLFTPWTLVATISAIVGAFAEVFAGVVSLIFLLLG